MDRKCGIFLIICSIVCIAISGCLKHSGHVGGARSVAKSEFAASGPMISTDCIVTFYDDQSNSYISEQRHRIFPSSSAVMIEATEPEGKYEWGLSNGVFNVMMGDPVKLPVALCSSEIARAIVLAVSARGGFLGDKAGVMGDPVSIAGRMYQPIDMYAGDDSPVSQKVYREISSNQIDWVEIRNSDNNALIAARSYNVRNLADSGKVMPSSIDIYNTDSSGRPSNRIMNIEYKSFELLPTM